MVQIASRQASIRSIFLINKTVQDLQHSFSKAHTAMRIIFQVFRICISSGKIDFIFSAPAINRESDRINASSLSSDHVS